MKITRLFPYLLVTLFSCCLLCAQGRPRVINGKQCELKNGALYVDGKWQFMKSARVVGHFSDPAVTQIWIDRMPMYKKLGYTNIVLVCHWRVFDTQGTGEVPASSVEPLRRLVDTINAQGMFASLAVETYSLGAVVPEGFWKNMPAQQAVTSDGKPAIDTDHKSEARMPSFCDEAYLEASRNFIANLTRQMADKNFLYCETSTHPHYMGTTDIDYNAAAKKAYDAWRKDNTGAPLFPATFPIRDTFLKNKHWNRFRAERLAAWINGEIAALRENSSDKNIWIAVDYFDNGEGNQRRLGDAQVFLNSLGDLQIMQVYWNRHHPALKLDDKAYGAVYKVMKEKNVSWAVTESNSLGFEPLTPKETEACMKSTIRHGTQFGWEFHSVDPGLPTSQYDADWNPRANMAVVDKQWDKWLKEIEKALKR